MIVAVERCVSHVNARHSVAAGNQALQLLDPIQDDDELRRGSFDFLDPQEALAIGRDIVALCEVRSCNEGLRVAVGKVLTDFDGYGHQFAIGRCIEQLAPVWRPERCASTVSRDLLDSVLDIRKRSDVYLVLAGFA